MRERARDQGGPGTLTDDLAIPEVDPSALGDEPLAELAARYRLRPSAARPGVIASGPVLELSVYHGAVTMTGLWLWGIGWAVVALVVGFVFFWQAETRYGRG